MSRLSRRDFFRASTALAAGAAAPVTLDAAPRVDPALKPEIRRYKPFGRTGWKVGDISVGSGQREPAVMDHIFGCGVNLIDSGQQYGGHEEMLGKVLPKWRDKVFVIDKWDPSFVTATVTKRALLDSLDQSLKTLNTTYIDCMMLHSIGHPRYGHFDRIQNPAIYEAWEAAKKAGKIRFTGASSHSVRTVEEIGWGVDHDLFDVILVGANFLTRGIEPLLKKARAKGVATIAMKTMTIYKSDLNIRELQNEQTNARQAVIKWILASDLFDTMIISMRNYDQVAEYLAVSGTTSLTAQDHGRLQTVAAAIDRIYCRPGCNGCYGTCPHDVPIWDVLRYKMYFEHYGDEKLAMQKYRAIPVSNRGHLCRDCAAPCEQACPYGLPVRERVLEAHRQLTLV